MLTWYWLKLLRAMDSLRAEPEEDPKRKKYYFKKGIFYPFCISLGWHLVHWEEFVGCSRM